MSNEVTLLPANTYSPVGHGNDLGVTRRLDLTQDDVVEALMASIEVKTSKQIQAAVARVKALNAKLSETETAIQKVAADATDEAFAATVEQCRVAFEATLAVPFVAAVSGILRQQPRERTLTAVIAAKAPEDKKAKQDSEGPETRVTGKIEVVRVLPATVDQAALLDSRDADLADRAAAEKEATELKNQETYALPRMRKMIRARYATHVLRTATGGRDVLAAVVGRNNELADIFADLAPTLDAESLFTAAGFDALEGPEPAPAADPA